MLERRSERGQVLVIIAIGLVALLGFTALAVDLGHAYGRRRAAQNACDAAAIAGARALAADASDGDIRGDAEEYAASNYPGLEPEHLTITIDRDERTVEVGAATDTDTFFARVIGVNTLPVHARAKARWFYGAIETVEGVGSVIPMTVQQPSEGFKVGEAYDMMEGTGPGMFGWLRFNGCDTSCDSEPALEWALTEALGQRGGSHQPCASCTSEVQYCSPNWCPKKDGDYGPLFPEIGEWISGGAGKVNGDGVRYALKNIILGYDSTSPDDPWPIQNPVTVPIYEKETGGGANAKYQVAGFAQFKICCYNLSGNSTYHQCDEGHCAEASGPEEYDCSKCVGKCTNLSGNDACVCGVFLGEVPSSSGDGSQRTYRDNVIKLVE